MNRTSLLRTKTCITFHLVNCLISVANKKDGDDGFPIGRNTPLGNPYSHIEYPGTILVASRAVAVFKYKSWLSEQIANKNKGVCNYLNTIYSAAKRRNINLVCSCVPLLCHGEIVKEVLENKWFQTKNDGKNHLNIYSRGATELGRMLSNFAETPFELDGLQFKSIEAYWYWLNSGCTNTKIRELSGYKAKQLGRTLDTVQCSNFNERILGALDAKYTQTPRIKDLLTGEKRMLTHYIVCDNVAQRLPQYDWQVKFWESKKS